MELDIVDNIYLVRRMNFSKERIILTIFVWFLENELINCHLKIVTFLDI